MSLLRTSVVFFPAALPLLALALTSPAARAQTLLPAANQLIASDGAANDNFGYSVALSGNRALIGAVYDTIDNNSYQGSAYLFDATTGTQLRKFTASDGAFGDQFGVNVSLSDNFALIGAFGDDIGNNSNQGSAYLFDATTGTQLRKLTASDGAANDSFGYSTSLSGNLALVGAFGGDTGNSGDQGSAYLFDATTGTQLRKLIASDGVANDFFGYSAALSGNFALIGAWGDDAGNNSDQGSVYVFDTMTGTQLRKLTASDGAANDFFGYSVALSGNFALIGAWGADVNGISNKGAAYLFDITTGQQLSKFTANDGVDTDQLGYSVALSGNFALIGANLADIQNSTGATNQGAAYLFNITTGQQVAKYAAADTTTLDSFGYSVALSGSMGLVGAHGDDIGSNADQGSAYRFTFGSAVAPEPSGLALLGLPLVGTVLRRRKRA